MSASSSSASLEVDGLIDWLPPDTAPKDGRLCLLLVRDTEHRANTEDAEVFRTIGFNTLEDTGEDLWIMAGWNWCQDIFTEGFGEVIGWLPIPDKPPST